MIAPISYHDTVRAQLRYFGITPITPVTPAAQAGQGRQDLTRFTPTDQRLRESMSPQDTTQSLPRPPA